MESKPACARRSPLGYTVDMSRVEVHKFGGTSVGSAQRMCEDAAIIAQVATSAQVCVVSSAMSKVTDALIDAASAAVDGDRRGALQAIAAIATRHSEALATIAPEGAPETQSELDRIADELRELMGAVVVFGSDALSKNSRFRRIGGNINGSFIHVYCFLFVWSAVSFIHVCR